ncbi:cyclic nucleotide-binding domain-containing protein 2-like [Chiloscyllium punctatum]|uniref:cyclic nucleotide-binding domain-containing protein 2-like n=1 Tax=Chiloscyllium punctatum TaxID=137246 RepID=UPI003B63462D
MMSLDMSKRGHQTFQRIAKTVKTICGINLVLKGYIQKAKVTKWVTYHLTRQSNLDKELLFNIHNFTKNKTERDSAKLKCLFSVLPHQRSTEDTAMIQSLLRKTRAFQVMPYIMQLEICQAAVYQQYEAKTIVLRKGHHSEACYFVLTGELIATLSDSCSENRNHLTGVVNEIQEGDLFGDAALLTNTKRPATILCKTNTELLLLNKEDFESILAGFLQQRYSAITELLRSLPIFTPWNAEKLTLLSYSSLLRYYRSGTAVIPKSSRSSFIVVVKSGRCNVVTNLKMGPHGSDLSQCPQQKKISGGRKDFPILSLMEAEKKLAGRSPQSKRLCA